MRRRWWAKKEGEGLTSAGSGHLWPRRGLPWRIPANKRGCKTLASGGAADLHGGKPDADQGDLAGVLRAAGARRNRAAWVATAARERGVRGEERRRRGFGWVRARERESVCVCVGALGRMDGWMSKISCCCPLTNGAPTLNAPLVIQVTNGAPSGGAPLVVLQKKHTNGALFHSAPLLV